MVDYFWNKLSLWNDDQAISTLLLRCCFELEYVKNDKRESKDYKKVLVLVCLKFDKDESS